MPLKLGITGIDHGHIFGMLGNLKAQDCTCDAYWTDGPAVTTQKFNEVFPEIEKVEDRRRILEDPDIAMVLIAVDLLVVASIPASLVMGDFLSAAPGAEYLIQAFHTIAMLQWTWELAKFCAIAIVCALMAYSYAGDQEPDWFWRVGAFIGLVLAIAHSADLHALIGRFTGTRKIEILILFAALIGTATSQFPARSRGAFAFLCLAGIFLLAAEFDGVVARQVGAFAIFTPSHIGAAWHDGWRMLGESLVLIGLVAGIRDIQISAVRYVHRGES